MGAPDVRIVSRVMPGMTSLAGRTSTSTGSAAVSRSNACALASARVGTSMTVIWLSWSSRCSGASGQRLVVALAQQLQLLPIAVDHGPEALGVLRRPDLRADQEVVRIGLERRAPVRER